MLALSSSLAWALPADKKPEPDPKSTTSVAQTKDFINFKNDDTLHGQFLGFTTSGKVIWKNEAAEKNIAFLPTKVRKIVINEGKEVKPFTHTSYVTLTNQDTIPGKITAINDKTITLTTDYTGEVKIPRNTISSIDFLPLGDKIQYRGPFTGTDWKNLTAKTATPSTKTSKDKKIEAWKFRNFSLQNQGDSGVIMLKNEFNDKSRFTFKVTTMTNVMPSFVLCSDQIIPKLKEDEKAGKKRQFVSSSSANIAGVIGTGLVFRLHSYSSSLSLYGFDEDGKSVVQSLSNMLSAQRIGRQKKDHYIFDVRIDKQAGTLLLYSDGAAIGQWDISPYLQQLKGKKIGFANMYRSTTSSCVVSDIVVSSWNGVMDPAASMENDERDTILLTNGTDRYSGKALKLESGKLQLKGAYAELAIPTDQIQSLYLAKKNRLELRAKNNDEVSVRFYGTGRITGTLSKGPEGKIILDSEVLGKLAIDYSYISSYEFVDMDYAYEIIK